MDLQFTSVYHFSGIINYEAIHDRRLASRERWTFYSNVIMLFLCSSSILSFLECPR